ncbi:hypothetical protein IE53DRAFT_387641 [Violaceomyces palustris]|uniref:Uncharacterized protein n=1 Tax=Violaceomyces palustris TaxID=1673888 RepID=A0ACD0NW88_9BASI|nr:hypothetical protein IE53DRAFT_387641 [Violaceomyces palustris]
MSSSVEPTTNQVREAISSIQPIQDLKRIGTIPCARTSLLMGMATAAGVSGISLAAGRGLRRGLNWGVGSFIFISLASWETCRRSRKLEHQRMRTVIESYSSSSNSSTKKPQPRPEPPLQESR